MGITELRAHAKGQWAAILSGLGIDIRGDGKHSPCPTCGGKDRFRFDDRDGSGCWFCNQCEPHAGDGFALIMNVQSCAFRDAIRLVSEVLGYGPPRLVRVTAQEVAKRKAEKAATRRREQAKFLADARDIDTFREADSVIRVATGVDISQSSDAQLNTIMDVISDAWQLRLDEERKETPHAA